MTQPIWKPSVDRIANANLTAFITEVQAEHTGVSDFDSLYQWSIENPEAFWTLVWNLGKVIGSRNSSRVLIDAEKMPGAKWFPDAKLNFAENLLRFRDDRPAIISWNEHGRQGVTSFAELAGKVAQTAAALKKAGVEVGDRVAAFMPNIPETVIGMLAATSIGAIWSSTSPDFGLQGVLDRFGQIEPKILFSADGYFYNGKQFDSSGRVKDIVDQIPSIEQTVVVPYANASPDIGGIRAGILFEDFLQSSNNAELVFERLPFDHPVYILYSSGTTGNPKCIVHGAGGTLLQHLKELVLHTDLKRDDKIFYFTTCGWMMWNWLVSGLAVGATIVLYDGSPFYPDANQMFGMAAQERISVFGTSAKFISAAEKAGIDARQTHDLSSLRTILSTGSPLAAESFDFVYAKIKEDVCLCSISGGTDIVSCFALGNPIAPVYRGEIQTRGLGMAVQVFDDDGKPVTGQLGELVCTAPFPSMPVYFWNDESGEKYRDAYFQHFPNVWRHGDYVELTEHGGMIIQGRSDAVLNPGGVRIGTAEIYRQVEQLDEVLESVVVGQQWDDDVRIVLFVKLREDSSLDEMLKDKIKRKIRENTTPRHVPKKIIQIADIPRTISGKIVELAVRNVIHGRAVTNRDALANPTALDLYKDLPELQF